MSTKLGPRVALEGKLGEAERGSVWVDDGKESIGDEDGAAISLCFCSALTSAATDWANEAMTDTNAAVVAVALPS